jgi:hypothetical protein
MGTVLVEARPGHAGFVAWVVLTAFRSHLPQGLWDFSIEGDEERRLRYLEALATTRAPHWAHHSTFLVAEVRSRSLVAISMKSSACPRSTPISRPCGGAPGSGLSAGRSSRSAVILLFFYRYERGIEHVLAIGDD